MTEELEVNTVILCHEFKGASASLKFLLDKIEKVNPDETEETQLR